MKRTIFQSKRWGLLLALAWGLGGCYRSVSDDSITQAIQAKFYSDAHLKNDAVQVAVAKGEVTLSGEVANDGARLQAYKLASETPGVKKVIDAMQVRGAQTPVSGQNPELAAGEKGLSAQAEGGAPGSAPSTPTPPSKVIRVPAGTQVRVQMIDSINSKTSQVGSTFQASLYSPITMGNHVVVPKGADVYVKLVAAKSAGRIKGSSELEVALDRLMFHGKSIPLESGTVREEGGSRGKQTATRTALGGGIGAAIGAIAGGGKGAAIGAGIGAGGAVAVQALTHGKEVNVPSETKLDFTLSEPFQVTIEPKVTRPTAAQ